MGLPFDERGARFRASFEYLRRMGEGAPSFDNPYGSPGGGMDLLPKPASGRLPLLITGSSQQTPEWRARNGDGWMTYPRSAGAQARVVADDNALVDREAAVRAGIGWYGKNANVLLPGRGSWFVLGSVITDAPLPASTEPVRDGCGTCDRCITGCPTGAIVEPGVVDARRCLACRVPVPNPTKH